MQLTLNPASKRLVLLGGGHSHLAVLMFFARHPLPGLDITLISKDIDTPYSGALPAFISGEAKREDLFIDLRPLATMAGARIIQASIESIDLDANCIHCPNRPPVHFDYLSINIGSRPNTSLIPGADEFALSVKPIPLFLEQWQALLERTKAKASITLTIVGGGPASVEMACAMQERLRQAVAKETPINIHILTRASAVLGGHSPSAQRLATRILSKRGIAVHTHCQVSQIADGKIYYQRGEDKATEQLTLATDCCIVATGASPAPWLHNTGLALDEHGFIRVNNHLQSISHPNVFAAGDIATIAEQYRPKSGVYAVRQGKPLAQNLRRFATGASLKTYRPQRQALALLNMGQGIAIASRGSWAQQGHWVARWKRWIDQRFVCKYTELPAIVEPVAGRLDSHSDLSETALPPIRCAGCAAKLSSQSLGKVIAGLHTCTQANVLSSLHSTEDASVIQIDEQRVLLQSVDYLRSFINDPYLFARIASNHCLSDIHAMGAVAHSALAIVGLPHSAPAIMEDHLSEVMRGCTEVLNAHNTTLLGGHTSEAESLSFGLSVNAFAHPERLLRKSGMQEGDVLILTKALGTGVLFAADMRYRAAHRWIDQALAQMQHSNHFAAQAFVAHGATACTDITGFGLLGHLREMILDDACAITLHLDAVPLLDGAMECLRRGVRSSLHADNASHAKLISNINEYISDTRVELLFDPQTAGGLLAAVPQNQAQACLAQLHHGGDTNAACIGRVQKIGNTSASVVLVDEGVF